jgi:hypothetical protein
MRTSVLHYPPSFRAGTTYRFQHLESFEMKKVSLKLSIAALSLAATVLFGSNAYAQFVPALTYYAAGSSAQFNTMALAGGVNVFGGGALCGAHHWTQKNPGGANTIAAHDARTGGGVTSIPDQPGNIWVEWNDAAATHSPNAVVCFYLVLDSIVGVREYEAAATLVLPAGLVLAADQNIVPLLGAGEPLPANIQNIINGVKINAAHTDIRPEDAKFASMRAMTAQAAQVTGRSSTGVGFGPFPVGALIHSTVSTATAQPVDFAIDPSDVDPITGGAVRRYAEIALGAAPVMVFANYSSTGSGHFGDPALAISDINLSTLAITLAGGQVISIPPAVNGTNFGFHIRDISTAAGASAAADPGIHTFIREPLSGTYNTMEWSIPNSWRVAGDVRFAVGQVSGQDANVAANPLSQTAPNTGARERVVGSGEMVSTVNNTVDGFGYSFFNFSSFQGKNCNSVTCVNGTNALKYLTVDGVDPLFSGPAENPNGVGVFPQCTTSGGVIVSCPQLPFSHIVDGGYGVWSKYRVIYDASDTTNITATIVGTYAQEIAANPPNGGNPGSGILTDFVPVKNLHAFHSHYTQVVRTSGVAFSANNGFKTGVPETGGDAGGLVLTIQSELDFIADTGGNQQVNFKQ